MEQKNISCFSGCLKSLVRGFKEMLEGAAVLFGNGCPARGRGRQPGGGSEIAGLPDKDAAGWPGEFRQGAEAARIFHQVVVLSRMAFGVFISYCKVL